MEPTQFASAERATTGEIRDLHQRLAGVPLLQQLLSAVPDVVLLLNEHRQIVYANAAASCLVDPDSASDLLGARPGDALKCVHAKETPGGCGTTEFCQTCGAVRAILSAQRGRSDVRECRIAVEETCDALDLEVSTTPFEYQGEALTICAVRDISHQKRRRALERTFFHDILNTAGGLRGFVELLLESNPEEIPEVAGRVQQISRQLIEAIESQRALSAAESGDLSVNLKEMRTKDTLEEIAVLYRRHEVACGKGITVAADSENLMFQSDHALLLRVLGNMLKNALEATSAGGNVTLGSRRYEDQVEFWVNNSLFMPREVQLQVFQRSFSTKGPGRGLGTYSIRLLATRYLNGTAEFETSEHEGTTFRVRFALNP